VPAPEKLIIDTPEQVALEFELAGAGSRFLALALDTLLQAAGLLIVALFAIAAVVVGVLVSQGPGTWGIAIAIVLAFILYYGYFAVFEALWSGQTPGKRWVGLRVISESGRPIGVYDALLRNLLRIVDSLPALYALGILSIFLTSRNQRIGDLAAGTVVVHDRGVERPSFAAPPSFSGARYGAGRLAGDEIAAIEAFLARRYALEDDFRSHTARDLVARIRPRLTIPAEATFTDETLLEHVVAEYRESGRYR
jgi:uncharacterized RDD family membrane protein YckC